MNSKINNSSKSSKSNKSDDLNTNLSNNQQKRIDYINKIIDRDFKKYDDVFQHLAKVDINNSKNLQSILEEDKELLEKLSK